MYAQASLLLDEFSHLDNSEYKGTRYIRTCSSSANSNIVVLSEIVKYGRDDEIRSF